MTEKHDVIIVGGGPSGTSLGYRLLQAGYDCLILEKCVYPREKLCGGLLTEKTVALLEELYQKPFTCFRQKTDSVKIFDKKGKLRQQLKSTHPFWLVDRTEFDAYLAEEYRRLGGRLLEGKRVQTVDPQNHLVCLAEGTKFQYRYLVGADGANSIVRKHIDKAYKPTGFCLEINPRCAGCPEDICLYVGIADYGYGWIFPKKDRVTAGMGGDREKNPRMLKRFQHYRKKQGFAHTPDQIKGAFVPYGTYVKQPAKNHLLLVGDAAGLADPLTGEGIYFALLSAQYAAEAILSGSHVERVYTKKTAGLRLRIWETALAKKLFFVDFVCFCVMYIAQWNRGLVRFALDHAVSWYDTNYWLLLPAYLWSLITAGPSRLRACVRKKHKRRS